MTYKATLLPYGSNQWQHFRYQTQLQQLITLPSAPSTNSQCYAGLIPICFPFWAKCRLFSTSFSITQNGFFSTESSTGISTYTNFDALHFSMWSSVDTSLAPSTSLTAFWVRQVSPHDVCLKLTVTDVNFVDCPASFSCQVQTGREKRHQP